MLHQPSYMGYINLHISLPGTSEPELKIQTLLRRALAAAATATDSNPQFQAHFKGGRRRLRRRSYDRRRRRREEAVDHRRLSRGSDTAGKLRRRVVEVGQRSPVLLGSSSSLQVRRARKLGRRRPRRRAALPEPGPVPPVDVHVAAQRLRRPELAPAVAAGVGGRRRRQRPLQRPREAAAGQAEVVARRP